MVTVGASLRLNVSKFLPISCVWLIENLANEQWMDIYKIDINEQSHWKNPFASIVESMMQNKHKETKNPTVKNLISSQYPWNAYFDSLEISMICIFVFVIIASTKVWKTLFANICDGSLAWLSYLEILHFFFLVMRNVCLRWFCWFSL